MAARLRADLDDAVTMAHGAARQAKPLSPVRTGRAAHVSDLSPVTSREDVMRTVAEVNADLDGGGATEWENGTLARFLEAYGAVLDGLDGIVANRGEPMPDQPDWKMLATLLVAATGYE